MRKLIVAGCFLLSLATMAACQGSQPWNEKDYKEWTQADLIKIFSNSPWVVHKDAVNIQYGPISRGQPDPTKDPTRWEPLDSDRNPALIAPTAIREPKPAMAICWASAQTWREFRVRRAQLSGMEDSGVEAELAAAPTSYKIVILGGRANEYKGLTEASLRQSAYLETEKTRQKIPAANVAIANNGVVLQFPREVDGHPSIPEEETKIKVHCKLKLSSIKAEFDTRKMTRKGQRDL